MCLNQERPINCMEKKADVEVLFFISGLWNNPWNNKLYMVLWWIYHTIYIEQSYFCPWPWGNYGLRWTKETWTVNGSKGHLKFQMFQRLFVERKGQFSSLVTPIRAFIIKTLLCSSSGFQPWCNRLASFYELSMTRLHPWCIQMEMSSQYETWYF